MNSKEITLTESNNSYELLKKKLDSTFSNADYEITNPTNQWTINPKGKKCLLVKKSLWNSACIEINEKKNKIEVFSVISNPSLDTVFRNKLGIVGMLVLEPSWKKLRNEVFEVLN
jgi:hypothetical protein